MTGYIYKIFDKNNEAEFYIGSTINLSRRKSSHKKHVTNKVSKKYWCKLYQYIRANGGWENFTMEVFEVIEDDYSVLKIKEQEYIDQMKPTLNSIRACKSKTI